MSPGVRVARSLAGLSVLAVVAAPACAEAQTFAVDPATSHVRILLGRTGLMKFLGHEHHIEAPIAEGRVEVVEGDPARSSVQLRFASARLALVPGSEPAGDIPKVEERMRGPEVLEVVRYAEIAFVSTSVRSPARAGAGFRLVVAGSLTLRGRAFPVAIPLEVVREEAGLVARGEVALNLLDLGLEPPSVAGVVKVANAFKLEFEIRAHATARP